LDGEFNSSDLTLVFQASRYEEQLAHPNDRYLNPVGWSEGDWNGDLQFNSKDLIVAFRTSAYEQGQRPLQAVPEPGFAGLAVAFVIWFSCRGTLDEYLPKNRMLRV
jgi:hypothetical protein